MRCPGDVCSEGSEGYRHGYGASERVAGGITWGLDRKRDMSVINLHLQNDLNYEHSKESCTDGFSD